MNTTLLRPMMSMAEIYGPGRIYAPRAHDRASDWLSHDPMLLDSLTGNQLPVLGDMPLVCSAGFNTPAGLEMLADAGLEPASVRYPFRAGEAIAAAKHAMQQTSGKLVLQHAHPPDVLPVDVQWIDPHLLCYLNNKANLAELVPPEFEPPRKIVDRRAFFQGNAAALPLVLKAVSDQSSGGGVAVVVCRTPQDLAHALQVFAQCERIVVESFLEIESNPCLHFAVTPDGQVKFLGFAEQDVTDAGRYRGNWMELGSSLSPAIVDPAFEVVRRGAAIGFRGIVGIDMVLLRDGRIFVLDLNFRVNGSTAAVLLAPAILEDRGRQIVHLRGFKGTGTANDMAAATRAAVGRGQIIPMSLFDSVAAGYPGQAPALKALVLGSSHSEVLALEAELAHTGLV